MERSISQPARAQFYESPSPVPAVADAPTIPTRFGALAPDPERIIAFPHGLLGFPDQRRYVLADIPGADAASSCCRRSTARS